MKSLVITGSRGWTDYDTMEQALGHAYLSLGGTLETRGGVTLISGHALGADQMAESIWQEKVGELWISRYPANDYATPIARNDVMLSLSPDLVLAFQLPCRNPQCRLIGTYGLTHSTHGTAYTVAAAERRNLPLKVIQGV